MIAFNDQIWRRKNSVPRDTHIYRSVLLGLILAGTGKNGVCKEKKIAYIVNVGLHFAQDLKIAPKPKS